MLCACPPEGTDNRFRKCVLPRRMIGGPLKGPRDEIDVIVLKGSVLRLIECKATLSDALQRRNALGENDVEKLRRVVRDHGSSGLATLLSRGLGTALPHIDAVEIALAVARADARPPVDCILQVVEIE